MLAISEVDKQSRLAMRASIEQFEAAIQEEVGSERGIADDLNAEGLEEYLVGGAYTRIITMPAGVAFVSELWNRDRLWILLKGTLHVRTETGDKTLVGPCVEKALFGSKVIGYSETEAQWAAITGCTETEDLKEVEKFVVAKGYEELVYPWDNLEHQS